MSFDPKCMIFDILDAIGVIELLYDVWCVVMALESCIGMCFGVICVWIRNWNYWMD